MLEEVVLVNDRDHQPTKDWLERHGVGLEVLVGSTAVIDRDAGTVTVERWLCDSAGHGWWHEPDEWDDEITEALHSTTCYACAHGVTHGHIITEGVTVPLQYDPPQAA